MLFPHLYALSDNVPVVFHDDNEETVKALSKIIAELKKRGFQFATVSQLAQINES